MRRYWVVACAALFALACNNNNVRCDGKDVLFGGGSTWRRVETCESACIETNGRAFCATTTTPDPRCGGSTRDGSRCDGAQRIDCVAGYLVGEASCAVTCAALPDEYPYAACALEDAPTPACKRAVAGCEDNTWVGCQSGLAIERVACPAETYCRSVAGRGKDDGAVCALAPAPDPRCAVGRGFCEGNTLHRCRDGYLVFIAECITSCQWRQADNGDDYGWCDGGGTTSTGFDDGVPSSSSTAGTG